MAEELPPRFPTLVHTAAYTGMRWGELIGLRRARVDLVAPAITVVEQLVILECRWVRKTPKTAAGRRRITLPTFLADLLVAQLDDRAEPGPDGLVFPNRAGNPINPSSFNGAHWVAWPMAPVTQPGHKKMTGERHKIGASGGHSRSLPVRPKIGSDLQERIEAASGIEPLYRALQALA